MKKVNTVRVPVKYSRFELAHFIAGMAIYGRQLRGISPRQRQDVFNSYRLLETAMAELPPFEPDEQTCAAWARVEAARAARKAARVQAGECRWCSSTAHDGQCRLGKGVAPLLDSAAAGYDAVRRGELPALCFRAEF